MRLTDLLRNDYIGFIEVATAAWIVHRTQALLGWR
jgi:hypothetical protein